VGDLWGIVLRLANLKVETQSWKDGAERLDLGEECNWARNKYITEYDTFAAKYGRRQTKYKKQKTKNEKQYDKVS